MDRHDTRQNTFLPVGAGISLGRDVRSGHDDALGIGWPLAVHIARYYLYLSLFKAAARLIRHRR